jgi:hypothetical protein
LEEDSYQTISLVPTSTSKVDKRPPFSNEDPQQVQAVVNDLPKTPNIVPDDYNEKYNIVIRQYNHDINRIGYVYLSELPPHSYVSATRSLFCDLILSSLLLSLFLSFFLL